MADEHQLAVLRDGVSRWNLWRKANPDIVIDLSKADRAAAPTYGVRDGAFRAATLALRGVRDIAGSLEHVIGKVLHLFRDVVPTEIHAGNILQLPAVPLRLSYSCPGV